MKFSTYAALIGVATAIEYCDENKNCAEDSANVCIGRYIKSIDNPQNSQYKIALKSDPEMIVESKTHICVVPEMADALATKDFVKDNFGVTAKYWTMDDEVDFKRKAKHGKGKGKTGSMEYNSTFGDTKIHAQKGKGYKNVEIENGDKYMKYEKTMNKSEGWYAGSMTYDAQDGKGEQKATWSLKRDGDYKKWKWGKSGATGIIGSGIALATVAMMTQ